MERRDSNGLTEKEFLAKYDPDRYQKPAVTVDMLIFTVNPRKEYSLELLMIERGGHPFLGKWAIPGGFVEMEESVDAAAVRELREETTQAGFPAEYCWSGGENRGTGNKGFKRSFVFVQKEGERRKLL